MVSKRAAVLNKVGPVMQRVRGHQPGFDPSVWRLDVGSDGQLERHGRPLRQLTEAFGSPVHVIDTELLDDAATAFTAAIAPARIVASPSLVGVRAALARLVDAGADVVVASEHELLDAERLGVDAARVVFNGVLDDATVAALTPDRVRTVCAAWPGQAERLRAAGLPVAVTLRLDASDVDDADLITDAAETVAVIGAPTLLRVEVVGDVWSVDAADRVAARVASVVKRLAEATDWRPSTLLLDVEVPVATVDQIGNVEARLNRAFATDLSRPSRQTDAPHTIAQHLANGLVGTAPEVLIAPGTSLTASAGMMLITVLDVKTDRVPTHAILDAGINLAPTTLYAYHQLFNASATVGVGGEPARFAGPICTPADVLYTNWRLPRLDVGDVLAVMDTGARFVAEATSFSFPQPAIVFNSPDGATVARAAEAFEHLVALDHIPRRGVRP